MWWYYWWKKKKKENEEMGGSFIDLVITGSDQIDVRVYRWDEKWCGLKAGLSDELTMALLTWFHAGAPFRRH